MITGYPADGTLNKSTVNLWTVRMQLFYFPAVPPQEK